MLLLLLTMRVEVVLIQVLIIHQAKQDQDQKFLLYGSEHQDTLYTKANLWRSCAKLKTARKPTLNGPR